MKLLISLICLTAVWFLPASAEDTIQVEPNGIAELHKKADNGDAAAQFNLAAMYARGQGVPKDEAEAVKWLRKAAEQGGALAQYELGKAYAKGRGGLSTNELESLKWYRKAAEQGFAAAQARLGSIYSAGRGVPQDGVEAARWYKKAAENGDIASQLTLGRMYEYGRNDYGGEVPKDETEAAQWYQLAAIQGDGSGQFSLGTMYQRGRGVPKNDVQAYMWFLLSAAKDSEIAREYLAKVEIRLTAAQRAEGQKLAREFKPRTGSSNDSPVAREGTPQAQPESSGSGFFITADGYFITNQHVADEGSTVRVLAKSGNIPAKVVKVDKANDLALLKAEGKFTALPVIASRGARLGATVATVGFPNTGLQGFAPKLAKGEIASLAGAQDDARHFQISAPIQPGNSGGALVDERGNVIGVVVAKLSQQAALATSGTLAENVNYAVKSSYLLSFLESVPAVAAQLKEPNTQSRPFEDVVKDVEQATVLVLVY